MGGRVAEEIIFGPSKATTGASNDFESATEVAQNMVKLFGFSDKMGHVSYPSSSYGETNEQLSDSTKHMIETEVRTLVEGAYQKAKKVLSENKRQLELLAKALLEHETLTLKEVELVISGQDIKPLIENRKEVEEQLRLSEKEELQLIADANEAQQQPVATKERKQKNR